MVTAAPNGESWRDLARHWLRFNAVGALGVVVQLLVLAGLIDGLGLNYLWATLIAVEAAILHNFAWHERWTWADRTRHRPGDLLVRLVRFNTVTGLTSILGNLVLMRLFVGALRLHYLAANLLSIALCYVLNFAASEWFVFRCRRIGSPPTPPVAQSHDPNSGLPR
jgi:putative flippase GtrA